MAADSFENPSKISYISCFLLAENDSSEVNYVAKLGFNEYETCLKYLARSPNRILDSPFLSPPIIVVWSMNTFSPAINNKNPLFTANYSPKVYNYMFLSLAFALSFYAMIRAWEKHPVFDDMIAESALTFLGTLSNSTVT